MTVNDIPEYDFIKYLAESKTWTEFLKKCGYNNTGNTQVVKKRIQDLKLDDSHLPIGQNWAAGLKLKSKKYTIEEILIENSSYTNSKSLKNRLKKELGWEHKCHCCNLTEWLTKPIPIELEHKNGIHNDNRLENLAFLCPNCHALTDTYKGKNVKTYKDYEKPELIKCIDCKIEITKDAIRCQDCSNKNNRKTIRPSYEQLCSDKEHMSMVAIGKKYGVSDNTIRKWIKKYKKDIEQ